MDGNIDPSDSQGLLGVVADDDLDEVRSWTVAAYDRWNDMLAERAEAAGFVYVDLYHEFNGPDGSQPFGELSTDGAHPSQLGHDLISSKLEAVELSVVRALAPDLPTGGLVGSSADVRRATRPR